MIKTHIESLLKETLKNAAPTLGDAAQDLETVLKGVKVETPRNREHGDYAVNVSYLAKWAKMAPPKIAEVVHAQLAPATEASTIAGFINFKVDDALLASSLLKLLQTTAPGKNQAMSKSRILLEYVSANPTGPLHIGHGRWAALGDSLRRLFEHCGAEVHTEFYVNDFGNQMGNISSSLYYRCLEVLGLGRLPAPIEGEPYPFYPGEYVLDLAHLYLSDTTRKNQFVLSLDSIPRQPEDPETARQMVDELDLKTFAKQEMIHLQQELLSTFRVRFDRWYFESMLHESGRVIQALEKLKAHGYIYEEEGALWFASSQFGDEKDRVLMKTDGNYTYLTADIAYHDEKFSRPHLQREGEPAYNCVMNIWGADHHGYIPRMKAAVAALGHNPDHLEILLGQLVNLVIEGEKTRMGKRKKMLTLADIIDEVGVDATRFWMVSRSADNTIDFDVELAASTSDENPIFYVQYAHARCSGILRNATEGSLNPHSGEAIAPVISAEALKEYIGQLTPEQLQAQLFSQFTEEDAQTWTVVRSLVLLLDSFADRVADAGMVRAPHLIARYCLDLAGAFHSFYNVCRIITPDPTLSKPRLLLILAIQKTLAQGLDLLGVSAPERM